MLPRCRRGGPCGRPSPVGSIGDKSERKREAGGRKARPYGTRARSWGVVWLGRCKAVRPTRRHRRRRAGARPAPTAPGHGRGVLCGWGGARRSCRHGVIGGGGRAQGPPLRHQGTVVGCCVVGEVRGGPADTASSAEAGGRKA